MMLMLTKFLVVYISINIYISILELALKLVLE